MTISELKKRFYILSVDDEENTYLLHRYREDNTIYSHYQGCQTMPFLGKVILKGKNVIYIFRDLANKETETVCHDMDELITIISSFIEYADSYGITTDYADYTYREQYRIEIAAVQFARHIGYVAYSWYGITQGYGLPITLNRDKFGDTVNTECLVGFNTEWHLDADDVKIYSRDLSKGYSYFIPRTPYEAIATILNLTRLHSTVLNSIMSTVFTKIDSMDNLFNVKTDVVGKNVEINEHTLEVKTTDWKQDAIEKLEKMLAELKGENN